MNESKFKKRIQKQKRTIMDDRISVSLRDFQIKLAEIDEQIELLQKKKMHVMYFIHEFFEKERKATSPIAEQDKPGVKWNLELYSHMDTKPLALAILRNEKRAMTWREVYDIFRTIKQNVLSTTLQVSLSQMSRDKKFPVRLIKSGVVYKYVYEEKEGVSSTQ